MPQAHPLRRIKQLADAALEALSATFDELLAEEPVAADAVEGHQERGLEQPLGRHGRAAAAGVHLDYNLLFRWFLDMDMVEASFDHPAFSKNRQRLLEHDVAKKFLAEVVLQARAGKLMSDDHFTVDGTLIEAWASIKSFRRKDEKPGDQPPPDDPGNPTVNFHGEKRSNETHESKTDPESKLYRKGKNHAAQLAYIGNVLMENRNGLVVDLRIDTANGFAERHGALALLDEYVPNSRSATLGADAGYDTRDFIAACRERGVTPRVAQTRDTRRRSAVDGRTVRHPGYAVSQRIRKKVEEIFGWAKSVAGFRKTRFKGRERTQLAAHFVAAAYNLLRISKLLPA